MAIRQQNHLVTNSLKMDLTLFLPSDRHFYQSLQWMSRLAIYDKRIVDTSFHLT